MLKSVHFPEGSRTAKGRSISNILEVQENEKDSRHDMCQRL